MDHARPAHHSSEELTMLQFKASQDKLNVLNVLATLNSEESTAYKTDSVLPVEISSCHFQTEEAALDQIAQKKDQLSKKMDHAVIAHYTTTSTLIRKNVF